MAGSVANNGSYSSEERKCRYILARKVLWVSTGGSTGSCEVWDIIHCFSWSSIKMRRSECYLAAPTKLVKYRAKIFI